MFERKKISPQSKSFLILFFVALIGTYACLLYSQKMTQNTNFWPSNTPTQAAQNTTKQDAIQPRPAAVETSAWKTYTNSKYGFSVKYPPAWQVNDIGIQTQYSTKYYTIELRPDKTSPPVKIYINHIGFFALDGLPTTLETLNGDQLINVKNQLFGLKHQDVYFTFYIGSNMKLIDPFVAFVHSIKF